MKPNPFVALYHFTIPISSTVGRSSEGYVWRSGRARRGGSCDAVLLSKLRISVTCIPFGPGPDRTSSVAPGSTPLPPCCSTTRACRNASPEPSASVTKPNPLSELNHLTVAQTGGPEGTSNCGPWGAAYPKLRLGGWVWVCQHDNRRLSLWSSPGRSSEVAYGIYSMRVTILAGMTPHRLLSSRRLRAR